MVFSTYTRSSLQGAFSYNILFFAKRTFNYSNLNNVIDSSGTVCVYDYDLAILN